MASTSEAARFFDDLVIGQVRLYNGMDATLRAEHGIVTSQLGFLRYVRDQPGTRVADLAAEFAIGIGASSKAVDRGVERGWYRREPNPDDRRSSLLVLTEAGRELADAAERTFVATVEALVGPEAIRALTPGLTALRGHLEDQGIGLPAG